MGPSPTTMQGWLVNDQLTTIPGTRTLWNHLLESVPGLIDKTTGSYIGLAQTIRREAQSGPPDFIIRNAAYFQRLEVDCPVIAFVQDISKDWTRDILLDACEASQFLVFNSEYTRAAYPELSAMPYRVIPVGTDTSIFHPSPPSEAVKPGAVLWVGSGHSIKNFSLSRRLARESNRHWIFVMKDDTEVPEAAATFRRVPQEMLAELASSCAVGVCTSAEETQHLAGIEMGLCGLPLAVTNVGIYHGRPPGPWGEVVADDWHAAIERCSEKDRGEAAAYWLRQGVTMPECMAAWNEVVEGVCRVLR